MNRFRHPFLAAASCLLAAGTLQVRATPAGRAKVHRLAENGLALDDLWSYFRAHPEIRLPHNVHFTPADCSALSGLVTTTIEAGLNFKTS